ncbi:ketoacyl-ACP synthase III [Roseateles asaccharophilus]|uniref:3-oxoacyl-[acyl-carrier-protein] synthase-3 n=1 Tax=Roseateles asaccharophilus TaxID=582607 RepID=A0ABU2ABY0_9BURK|nr:ketoacyl-ACP synthase III [Roseateles asaccharophilus]MDR7334703.1 3-oxoacyl-[acyl-carrier-protein] synthase-3 [Roseateles asaccharophilus]
MPLNATILDIAPYLPAGRLDNGDLEVLYPSWPASKILDKTGIQSRAIAAENETAGDLAFAAAKALFAQGRVAAADVDFVILCTQAPDYVLPTTACVLQHRLGIPTSAGALDVNLGCSGYVYCLSLAKGLIETGAARCVLLLTADTYSKYIHPLDKSVRTLFGDGATATAVVGRDTPAPNIGPFVFGTDGAGAEQLIVPAGGFRRPASAETALEEEDASGNVRSADHLYMNGAEVMAFTLREVPRAVDQLLIKADIARDDIDHFVLHQANRFMLEALRKKLKVPEARLPIELETVGNTVSSTIPLTLHAMKRAGDLVEAKRLMLVGFGVGLSWAACILTIEGMANE